MRYVVEECYKREDFDNEDPRRCIVDTLTNTVVGIDDGDTYDGLGSEKWSWVSDALNAASQEHDKLRSEIEALAQRCRQSTVHDDLLTSLADHLDTLLNKR